MPVPAYSSAKYHVYEHDIDTVVETTCIAIKVRKNQTVEMQHEITFTRH